MCEGVVVGRRIIMHPTNLGKIGAARKVVNVLYDGRMIRQNSKGTELKSGPDMSECRLEKERHRKIKAGPRCWRFCQG
jgi:hypothetical protein